MGKLEQIPEETLGLRKWIGPRPPHGKCWHCTLHNADLTQANIDRSCIASLETADASGLSTKHRQA